MLDTLRGTQKQSHESTGGNSRESGAVAALRRAGRVLKADGGLEVGGSACAPRAASRPAAQPQNVSGGLSRVGCHLVLLCCSRLLASIDALKPWNCSSSSPSNSSQVYVSRGLRGSMAGLGL